MVDTGLNTSGVSAVSSEVLPASPERAPTAALPAAARSLARRLGGHCWVTASLPGRLESLDKDEADPLPQSIVSPCRQHFRPRWVTGKSGGSKRLDAACTASRSVYIH